MGKIVTNPNSHKKEELGLTSTCFESGYKGWGTDCEKLVLKKDGYYHCLDCGLVLTRPVLSVKFNRPLAGSMQCECRELKEFCQMEYNDFFNYDIPHGYYRCSRCQLVYCYEDISHATVENQESEAAKRWVTSMSKMIKREHAENLRNISDDVDQLKVRLGKLNVEERKRLLKRLIK